MKIAKLMGLGHSGSTLLQLLLASHPRVIGIGEAHWLGKRPLPEACSCGAAIMACPMWGPLAHHDAPVDPRVVLDHFAATFPDRVAVDASKLPAWHAAYLRPGGAAARHDVRPIFLVRDFRGWLLSREKLHARKGRPAVGYLRSAGTWTLKNSELLLRASVSGPRRPLLVSYERLALETGAQLARLCGYLELPVDPAMASLVANTHVLWGNRMIYDAGKRSSIRYDDAWRADWRARLAPALLPAAALNRLLHALAR